jgi:PDZ domain-containing secreted protein
MTRVSSGKRRFWCGLVLSLSMFGGIGGIGSPYYRVDPGPMLQVGLPVRGSWSVTTVRVRDSTWFQWAVAELTGGRTVRAAGDAAPPMTQAMDTSQTYAVLVAAQLAARRTPLGSAGLQVIEVTGTSRGAGLRPGDVLLAVGGAQGMTPLRAQAGLEAAAARRTSLRLLVVPRTSGDSWGNAEIKQMPAARLTGVRASPAVSAIAYPLGVVQGPSAGLVLALARVDALTAGDLTGGRRIAGTGSISLDGTVTNVGEVAEKVHAAVAARVEVFFVPVPQRAVAVRAAQGTRVRIVPVRSVSEAVSWLCATRGRAPVC